MFNEVKENDNFETNKDVWKRLEQFIPKDKVIWSPFFCCGKQKQYFKELFDLDIIHEDEDFFENNKGEVIIDNPPFTNLRSILERLKEIDKPFMVLMPSSKINALWFLKMFKDYLQIIIPLDKFKFTNKNKNLKFNFNWGVYVYCYKMNLPKDLIFI